MTRLNQIKSYFNYLKKAKTKYAVHSPFVYEFITKVLNAKENYKDYEKIEKIRNKYLQDHREINVDDLGAGSRKNNSYKRKIYQIARYALMPKRHAQLLYRIIKHYNCTNNIELGTSLGITAAYLASAQGNLTTLEGSKEIALVAQNTFNELDLKNIELQIGHFDDILPEIINKQTDCFDFILIDGNHRYEPTLYYYNLLLQKTHNDSIIVFDDINWSNEMQQAWEDIKKHPATIVSIDLYYLGIIFLKKELSKQDFVIRF